MPKINIVYFFPFMRTPCERLCEVVCTTLIHSHWQLCADTTPDRGRQDYKFLVFFNGSATSQYEHSACIYFWVELMQSESKYSVIISVIVNICGSLLCMYILSFTSQIFSSLLHDSSNMLFEGHLCTFNISLLINVCQFGRWLFAIFIAIGYCDCWLRSLCKN